MFFYYEHYLSRDQHGLTLRYYGKQLGDVTLGTHTIGYISPVFLVIYEILSKNVRKWNGLVCHKQIVKYSLQTLKL